jgi:hypothetical protein
MKKRKKVLEIFIFILIFSILEIIIVSGARLPTVNSDTDNWGTVLNEFLQQEHNSDGTHGSVNATSVIEIRNAAKFPGSDIGAKINAAIADFSSGQSGIVIVPSSSWAGQSYSTQIVVDRPVHIIFPSRVHYATYTGTGSAINITSNRAKVTSFAVSLDGNSNSNVDGILIYGASDVIMEGGIYILNPVRHGIFIDAGSIGAYHNNFLGNIRIDSPGGDNIHLGSTGTSRPNANHFYGLVLNAPPTNFSGIRIAKGYSNYFNGVYIQSGQSDSWGVYNSGTFNQITDLTIDSDTPNGIKVDSGYLYISGLQNNAATEESITGGSLYKIQFNGEISMGRGYFGAIDINTTGTHLVIRESDAPNPNDYWVIESNVGRYNLYWRDDSESLWKRPFSVEADTADNTLYLDSSGKVGIGTASPSQKLDVVGDIAINDTAPELFFIDNTGGHDDWEIQANIDSLFFLQKVSDASLTGRVTFQGDGDVGIGTINPTDKFTVNASGIEYGIGVYGIMRFDSDSDSVPFRINYYGYNKGTTRYRDFSVHDGKTNTLLMVDGSAGNIGIGTTSPSAKLEINGTTTVPLVLVQNTTAITCDSGTAGGIIYSGGKHYGCNGTNWNALY